MVLRQTREGGIALEGQHQRRWKVRHTFTLLTYYHHYTTHLTRFYGDCCAKDHYGATAFSVQASISMGNPLTFELISKDDFDEILSRYQETVPSKLANLEEQRLSILPARLREREAAGKAYLTKDEVATLVDWKL